MAVIHVKDAVDFNGKSHFKIETDVMPAPDGSGLVFKASSLLDSNGMLKATLIPWSNITGMTIDVPPEFFTGPPVDTTPDGPGEL